MEDSEDAVAVTAMALEDDAEDTVAVMITGFIISQIMGLRVRQTVKNFK